MLDSHSESHQPICATKPFKGITKPVGIIAAIRQHVFGVRQVAQTRPRTEVVDALSGRGEQPQRSAGCVGDGMRL